MLYLLVSEEVTLAVPDIRDGRNREEHGSTIAKLDLFCALNAHKRSCCSFPPVSPIRFLCVAPHVWIGLPSDAPHGDALALLLMLSGALQRVRSN
jgi:hypothetical protein